MPRYEIWSEGYRASGDSSGAIKHGEADGENFKEAVARFATENPKFYTYYSPIQNTYWGCELFDNEVDARRRFG